MESNINFYGNVEIGKDISIEFLSQTYDVVIISSGAQIDKKLNINGEKLPGSYGSAEFVGWYNGHTEFSGIKPNLATKNAVIIGNGNVALDCARILAKTKEEFYGSDIMDYSLDMLNTSKIENIYVIGRRTPKDAKFTIAELRELGALLNCTPEVDYTDNDLDLILNSQDIDVRIKKNIEVLKSFKTSITNKNKKIIFKFLSTPFKIVGGDDASSITFKKNKIVSNEIKITEDLETIDTKLIISAIGYKVRPINDLKLDKSANYFQNKNGHIKDNIYTSGWAAGASVGVIGTNKIGAAELVKKILKETRSVKPFVKETVLDYMINKNVKFIDKTDWFKIDKLELNNKNNNFIRKKLTNIGEIFDKISN